MAERHQVIKLFIHLSILPFTPIACNLSMSFTSKQSHRGTLEINKDCSHCFLSAWRVLIFWLSITVCWCVEQYLLKPAYVDDRRFWVSSYQFSLALTIFSIIFTRVLVNDIGQYLGNSETGLFAFCIGVMIAFLHNAGIDVFQI
jgi:hypothetical protein